MIKKLFIVVVIALMVFMSVGCKEQIPDPPQPPNVTSTESVDVTNMKWVCKFYKEFRGMWKTSQPVWECYWE